MILNLDSHLNQELGKRSLVMEFIKKNCKGRMTGFLKSIRDKEVVDKYG